MDLMDIRRLLLAQGGSTMLGKLSKYQRIKVTPSESTNLTVSHNLGVVPKIIVLSSTQTFVATNFISDGIINQNCGNFRALYSADGFVGNSYVVNVNTSGTSNSQAYISDTSIVIRRATSARYFDTNTEYTVDVYA